MSTDRTSPITPERRRSCTCRDANVFELKIDTCVAGPSARTRSISRASHTLCAIGFWLYTCLPARIAAIAITACQWSGVFTTTASRSFSRVRNSR